MKCFAGVWGSRNSAVETELEFCVRVTVDLAKQTVAPERQMIRRALGLAKDIHAIRGTYDASLPMIEAFVHDQEQVELQRQAAQVEAVSNGNGVTRTAIEAEGKRIWDLSQHGVTQEDIARKLGISKRTVYRRLKLLQREHGDESPAPHRRRRLPT